MDECLVKNNGGCDQICTNTNGSYRCACRPGFLLNSDGRTCNGRFDQLLAQALWIHHKTCLFFSVADINECSFGNTGCSHTCKNVFGGFECQCPNGHKLGTDNKTCEGTVTMTTVSMTTVTMLSTSSQYSLFLQISTNVQQGMAVVNKFVSTSEAVIDVSVAMVTYRISWCPEVVWISMNVWRVSQHASSAPISLAGMSWKSWLFLVSKGYVTRTCGSESYTAMQWNGEQR